MTELHLETVAGDRLPIEVRAISDGRPAWVEVGSLRPGQEVVGAGDGGSATIRAIHHGRMPVFCIEFFKRARSLARQRRMTPSQRALFQLSSTVTIGAHQAVAIDYPGSRNSDDGLQMMTAAELMRESSPVQLPATSFAAEQCVAVSGDGYTRVSMLKPRGIRDVIWIELDGPSHDAFVITRSGVLIPALGLPADKRISVETRPNGSTNTTRKPVPDAVVAPDHMIDTVDAGETTCVSSLSLAAALMDGIDQGLDFLDLDQKLATDPIARSAVAIRRQRAPKPARKVLKKPKSRPEQMTELGRKRVAAKRRAALAEKRQAKAATA